MKILVTAGPTREPIDAVRFISNRSTGKMGYAIAASGKSRDHIVKLISGPVNLAVPSGVDIEFVETADDMLNAVVRSLSWCDVLIMAAAVADWRPAEPLPGKIKKVDALSSIDVERTGDILMRVKSMKEHRIYIGFAAETTDPARESIRKLNDKGLDLVVGNDVSRKDSGFAVDTNKVCFVTSDGNVENLALMSKLKVADRIIQWAENKRNEQCH